MSEKLKQKQRISDDYMRAIVKKCSEAQIMMDVIIGMRIRNRDAYNENKEKKLLMEKLERTIRDQQREIDHIKRENAELRSK